jgi:predicted GH43/DUF377 family glycosyl hydrolase
MLRRVSETRLLSPQDLAPSRDDFTVIGVFNPGVVKVDDEIVLLARVAERPLEHRSGFVGLPRRGRDGAVVIDWAPEEELEQSDPRVVRCKADGLLRLTSISHLRVFRRSEGGATEWTPGLSLLPASAMEEFGLEDPRITRIDDTYWITYVAVSRYGAATALASTDDWATFQRHGIIFCPENKDVVIFPEKIQGQYVALHRPNPSMHFSRPQIWLAHSPNLLHWGQHECMLVGSAGWESDRVGGGAPPIALDEGWLAIYHGSQRATRDGDIGAYSAGALLLDRSNPSRIVRRSFEPIMRPMADFERNGLVPNVVFPTALIENGELMQMYYGASDTYTAVVEFSRKELLAALH